MSIEGLGVFVLLAIAAILLVLFGRSIWHAQKSNQSRTEPSNKGASDSAGRSVPATDPTPRQESPAAAKRIFLSYRREDSADVTGRIYDRLTQAFEKAQVFKDVDSIPLGLDFREHLQKTVSSCDVVLVVMGDRWLTTATAEGARRLDNPKDFVRIELETALQRDIPVIPVLVRGASVPEEAELPRTLSTLAYRNGIAVRSDPDFHRDMDRLVQSLKTHLADSPSAT